MSLLVIDVGGEADVADLPDAQKALIGPTPYPHCRPDKRRARIRRYRNCASIQILIKNAE